jgi:hypothetical protein
MYQEFSIITIDTIMETKQIIITTNKAINENAVDNIIVELYERASKTPLIFDYEVNGENIIITLKDWPIPNTDYILGVQGITSVLEETLDGSVKKRIQFKSNVLSNVKIISPVMFQEVKSLDIKLVEEADDTKNLIGSYYIEIATDNAFFNIVHKTPLYTDNLTMYLKEHGQYFIRARVQLDESNYSKWCSMISFIYGGVKQEPVPSVPDDNHVDIPIDMGDDDNNPTVDITGPFIMIEELEQGVTPDGSLAIAFSNLIDDFSLENIT